MRLVGEDLNIPRAPLREPTTDGYLLLAAEVDQHPPILPNSRAKRKLIRQAVAAASRLARHNDVLEAAVFDALIFAPGWGEELLARTASHDQVRPARFDLVVLVQTSSPPAAQRLAKEPEYVGLADSVRAAATHVHQIAASNVRRIDTVRHDRKAAFLFNYFYAEDNDLLVPVWEHTAGWFWAKTSLRNSTVLQPLPDESQRYGIINHASWPHLRTFLPHLILRPSFRRYVLANFAANGIAAQPVIYRQV